MGGGSGDAAAALRLAAHAAGVDDPSCCSSSRARLGGDVPSQVAPGRTLMTGAGEHVRPLGPAGRLALVILPSPTRRSRRPPSTASSTALGAQRSPAELAELEARGGDAAASHNDLQDAARSLCPPIDDGARRGRGDAGADHVLVSGSGPTVFGPLRRDARAARAAAAAAVGGDRGRARRRGLRGGARGVKWGWLLPRVALAAFLVVRRRKLGRLELGAGVLAVGRRACSSAPASIDLPNIEKLIEDVGTSARPLDLPARRRARLPRDGRVRRAGRAGRDRGAGRRPRRRPGPDLDLFVLIAIVWTCAVAGDVTSYTLGRRLGRAWLLRHGARLKITEERLQPGRGVLRAARRR